MIHRTVGTGGDHADWSAAYIYLATVDPLADDYEFEQISNCTINNTWPSDAAANNIDLNGHYVKFYCPFPVSHQGDPTRGYITYVNGAAGFIRMVAKNCPVYPNWDNRAFRIENLYIRQTTNNDVTLVSQRADLQGTTLTVYAKNLLIRGFVNTSATGWSSTTPYGTRVYIDNFKIWNCLNGFSMQSSGGIATRLWHYFENSSIYNCSVALYTGGTQTRLSDSYSLKNIFFYSVNAIGSIAYTSLYNCSCVGTRISASNAEVKSNCKESLVAANEFISLVDTSSDFLKPYRGSAQLDVSTGELKGRAPFDVRFRARIDFSGGSKNVGEGGIAPTYTDRDIGGQQLPDEGGKYPIGCHRKDYDYV